MTEWDGVLLIDKPAGCTSHDVLDRLKKSLHAVFPALRPRELPALGHAGTLDPFATGLLIVLVGRAVRLSQYLLSSQKAYTGTIAFGRQTTTADHTGETIRETSTPRPPFAEIRTRAREFTQNPYLQIPPMFSAKKIDGVPLYEHARKGTEIARKAEHRTITRFEITESAEKDCVDFAVTASPGTYIRTLAEDLALKLGAFAHLRALRRTESGFFSLSGALPLEPACEIIARGQNLGTAWLSESAVLKRFPHAPLPQETCEKIRRGLVELITETLLTLSSEDPTQPFVWTEPDGTPLAIAQWDPAFSRWKLGRVLRGV